MANPSSLPLSIYRGDTYTWQFTLWQDPGRTQPADLTGVVARAQIRNVPAGTLLSNFNCTVQMPNVIIMNLDAANSLNLTGSGGVWDLQLTYTDGTVITILMGPVKVTVDVTDSAPPGVNFGAPFRTVA